jgi:hypothetical protein
VAITAGQTGVLAALILKNLVLTPLLPTDDWDRCCYYHGKNNARHLKFYNLHLNAFCLVQISAAVIRALGVSPDQAPAIKN